MYGSDGIAGVLNFISQKAPSDGKIENQLNTNYQSNNNLIANSFSNRGNKNGFVWEGRITNKMAGNYENNIQETYKKLQARINEYNKQPFLLFSDDINV